jgi:hypothetical protein
MRRALFSTTSAAVFLSPRPPMTPAAALTTPQRPSTAVTPTAAAALGSPLGVQQTSWASSLRGGGGPGPGASPRTSGGALARHKAGSGADTTGNAARQEAAAAIGEMVTAADLLAAASRARRLVERAQAEFGTEEVIE